MSEDDAKVSEGEGEKAAPKYLNAYANHCDLVIAPSSDLRNYLYQQKIKTPVCVLPTGLSDFAYEKCKESSDRIRRNIGRRKVLALYGVPDG